MCKALPATQWGLVNDARRDDVVRIWPQAFLSQPFDIDRLIS
jgi:hypothetical protein